MTDSEPISDGAVALTARQQEADDTAPVGLPGRGAGTAPAGTAFVAHSLWSQQQSNAGAALAAFTASV